MPNRIGNFINRVTGRDNNQNAQNQRRRGILPPQINQHRPELARNAGFVVQAAAQHLAVRDVGNPPRVQQANPRAGAAAQRANEPLRLDESNRNNYSHITLNDLRIGNEEDHQLVTIPDGRRARQMELVQPNAHEATDHLNDREYLQALSQDRALGIQFRNWIQGHHVLGANLPEQQLNNLVSRLRLIASAIRADGDLRIRMDGLSMDANAMCADRNNYFLNAMWGEAYNHHLINNLGIGNDNELLGPELFNLGVAHFRLDVLRRAIQDQIGLNHGQNVHTMLDTEFFLQDELDLPTRHSQPVYPGNGEWAEERRPDLIAAVQTALSADNGSAVINFLSSWEPWTRYITSLEGVAAERQGMIETFQNNMNVLMDEREDESSYVSTLSEADYLREIDHVGTLLNNWQEVVTGQATWTFLANYRTNILMDNNDIPDRLRNN